MKWFIAGCLLLVVTRFAFAMSEGPITMYFPHATAVYLVRIESATKDKLILSVTETLRGKALSRMSLVPEPFAFDAQGISEILILSLSPEPKYGGTVGGEMKGPVDWLYAPVIREGSKVYVLAYGDPINSHAVDKTIKGVPYLALERIKNLLKENPQKR